jgi:hypothetical protein
MPKESTMNSRNVLKITCAASLAFLSASMPARAELLTGITLTNTLVTFDSSTPGAPLTSVGVTGLQTGEFVLGIDRRPATGVLYGLGSTSRLYTINATTGVATQVGSAGAFSLSGTAFGFDFNPVVDRIRVVSTTGQNLRLNPNDGTLTGTDTSLAYVGGDPNAGATPRDVAAAYTNNFSGALTTTLFGIDSILDTLVRQGSPNGSPISPNTGQLFTIGPLGVDTSDLAAFDISGLSGTAYAAFTAPTGSASQLYTVNLATGAATLVGTIGTGVTLSGLAAATPSGAVPVPEPGTLSLLGLALAALLGRRMAKTSLRSVSAGWAS